MNNNGFEKYGHFSDNGRGFVITNVETPRPWVNYAWSDHLLVSTDQCGAGNNIYRDDLGNNSVAISNRFVYLKDVESGEIWTVGWGVIRLPLESYRCYHGLGYTELSCNHLDWHCKWRITATPESEEVWHLEIKNHACQHRKIMVYPGVAFALGGWVPYGTLQNYASASRISDRTLYASNRSNERHESRNDAFFTSSQSTACFELSSREFLGGFYGTWDAPVGITARQLSNHEAMNEDMVGVFQYELELNAKEQWDCFFSNASCFSPSDAVKAENRIGENAFLAALSATAVRTQCFSRLELELPDTNWTSFFNIWAKQQLMLLKDYTRIYLIGFRDSLQDATSLVAYAPELAAKLIKRTLAYQLSDGSALRGWCPIDEHKYADSGVWVAMAIAEYLRETADFSFLDQEQSYYDGGIGTIWEHLEKSLDWFQQNLGSHGLPKLYFGDWNDSLNIGIGGKGESVWLAMAMVVANDDASAIAEQIGKTVEMKRFRQHAEQMRATIEDVAWDGNWYLRGFDDDGNPVGGKACKAGKIFSEPQSWAVMAGLKPERLVSVVHAVNEFLQTSNGLTVCSPPFEQYDSNYGRISCMPPGWGENGSCYCHVTAFQVVADAMRRDGESAFKNLSAILPFHTGLPVEISGLEPYAFTNMFRGPANVRSGETFKGWTSGTVPWALRALTHYIIGVRPDFDGLIIDPIVPKKWDKVHFQRTFREAKIDITINNPERVNSENSRILLIWDGQSLNSNKIPLFKLTPGSHVLEINVISSLDKYFSINKVNMRLKPALFPDLAQCT